MTPIFTDGTNCKVEIKIMIYNPNYDQPIEFPSEFIGGTITSVRSNNLGGSSLSIPLKMHNSYLVYKGDQEIIVPYNQLFTIHTVIHLLVSRNGGPFRKLNAGVITSRSISFTPSSFSFNFNLKTKEHFIQENEIFFDLQSVNESGQKRAEENIEGAITGMSNMLKESKSIRDTIHVLWDELLCKFLLGKVFGSARKFGGVNIVSETSSEDPSLLKIKVTDKSYTQNFIHIVQFMSSVNIGQTINLMDILKSYSSTPMYEIFVDSLESVGGSSTSPDSVGNLSYDIDSNQLQETYEVKQDECVLVFRQTPFGYFTEEGLWQESVDPFYNLKIEQIKKISSQESTEDFKSGVHVSLSIYEQASLVINYPKYSSTLGKIFGKKLLNVKLAGLSGKKDPTKKDKDDLTKDLDKIRDMLFSIFCNPKNLKTLRLNIDIPFQFVRQGVPLYIDYSGVKGNIDLESICSVLGYHGYIESVTDTFDPSGKANTSLSLKWAVDPYNQFAEQKEPTTVPIEIKSQA